MANKRRRGFSLIEGLIGASILTLAVTATFGSWVVMFRHNMSSHATGQAGQLAGAEAERAKVSGADGLPLGTYIASSGTGTWTGAYDATANSGAGGWVTGQITYYDAKGNQLANAASAGASLAVQETITDSNVLPTTTGGYSLQPASQRDFVVTVTLVSDGSVAFCLGTELVQGGL